MYINPDRLTLDEECRVVRWLTANGCRDQIVREPIIVRGSVAEYRSICRRGRERSVKVCGDEIVTRRKRIRIRVPLDKVS